MWKWIALLVLMWSSNVDAGEWWSVGVRGAVAGRSVDGVTPKMYQAYGSWSWRQWQAANGVRTRLLVDGALGAITAEGDSGAMAALGLSLSVGDASERVVGLVGISPTWLGEDRFDGVEFGGSFHFTSHIGLALRIGPHAHIGYRYQHTSNASIEDPNPGIDLHMLELGYRF